MPSRSLDQERRTLRFRGTMLALVAACATLSAQHDRDKKPDPPARPGPAAKPPQESRRETPAEPRRESRSEPRRETPAEPRRETRVEPRRDAPSEHRREAPTEIRREPRTEPRREAPADLHREPRIEPRRETPTPHSTPTPPSRRESAERRDTTTRTMPSREVRRDPAPGRPTEISRGGPRPGPSTTVVRTRDGGEIHRTHSGAIREVRTPGGAVIRHSPSGVRHVEVIRPGGTVIVANATGRRGYVQRPLVYRDHHFVQRTYILNGVPHARIYRPWSYGGRVFHIYTPVYHYRPAFYSWAYTPWRRPIRYGWGWEARPWYGYYGGYFTPYRTYGSPAFWLADFLIATTLEAAFLAQRASVYDPPVVYTPSTALTPEVKQAIADEVRRQMEQEREYQGNSASEAVNAAPDLFSSKGPRVFMVSNTVMAYSGNQECPLVEGDVLQLVGRPSTSAEMAEVRVLSSRGGSCAKGSIISVGLTDLQEMQNHLRATLDQGLSTLQSEQGRNGLPTLPAGAAGTINAPYADEVRPDSNAADQISQVVQEANRSEQDIINQGPQDTGDATGSPTISLGMTLADVERSMGRPKSTVDLGSKKIYVYKDLKITFLNGRVSDVQ